jgi:uncharacterized membrane protein YgcG
MARDKSRHFVTDSLQLLQNGYKDTCTETAADFSKREAARILVVVFETEVRDEVFAPQMP